MWKIQDIFTCDDNENTDGFPPPNFPIFLPSRRIYVQPFYYAVCWCISILEQSDHRDTPEQNVAEPLFFTLALPCTEEASVGHRFIPFQALCGPLSTHVHTHAGHQGMWVFSCGWLWVCLAAIMPYWVDSP